MKNKLLIVWSSGEVEVANKLVLLYGSVMLERNYWEEATIMIWGPSAKLLAEDETLQEKVKKVQQIGVKSTLVWCVPMTMVFLKNCALWVLISSIRER